MLGLTPPWGLVALLQGEADSVMESVIIKAYGFRNGSLGSDSKEQAIALWDFGLGVIT